MAERTEMLTEVCIDGPTLGFAVYDMHNTTTFNYGLLYGKDREMTRAETTDAGTSEKRVRNILITNVVFLDKFLKEGIDNDGLLELLDRSITVYPNGRPFLLADIKLIGIVFFCREPPRTRLWPQIAWFGRKVWEKSGKSEANPIYMEMSINYEDDVLSQVYEISELVMCEGRRYCVKGRKHTLKINNLGDTNDAQHFWSPEDSDDEDIAVPSDLISSVEFMVEHGLDDIGAIVQHFKQRQQVAVDEQNGDLEGDDSLAFLLEKELGGDVGEGEEVDVDWSGDHNVVDVDIEPELDQSRLGSRPYFPEVAANAHLANGLSGTGDTMDDINDEELEKEFSVVAVSDAQCVLTPPGSSEVNNADSTSDRNFDSISERNLSQDDDNAGKISQEAPLTPIAGSIGASVSGRSPDNLSSTTTGEEFYSARSSHTTVAPERSPDHHRWSDQSSGVGNSAPVLGFGNDKEADMTQEDVDIDEIEIEADSQNTDHDTKRYHKDEMVAVRARSTLLQQDRSWDDASGNDSVNTDEIVFGTVDPPDPDEEMSPLGKNIEFVDIEHDTPTAPLALNDFEDIIDDDDLEVAIVTHVPITVTSNSLAHRPSFVNGMIGQMSPAGSSSSQGESVKSRRRMKLPTKPPYIPPNRREENRRESS